MDEPRPGVVVLAKRWAFRGMNDNLAILGSNFGPVRNVTILGKGVLWKMWKHDCECPPLPAPNLRACGGIAARHPICTY